MTGKLKDKVGRGGKNREEDAKQVVQLLNLHIQNGALTHLKLLPAGSKGNDTQVINAIEEFQKKVVKLKKPDGRVDPGGKTIKALRNVPKSAVDTLMLFNHASLNLIQGPVGSVPQDLWQIGLISLLEHMNHPQIKKFVVMFVDFRKSTTEKRLWLVDLQSRVVLLNTLVSHGAGFNDGKKFSNVSESHDSSVGAYVTLRKTSSRAGHLGTKSDGSKKSGVAAIIDGLDSTNSRAKARHVIIHGASYVNNKVAGSSWGCFATRPADNQKIVEKMKDGGFIYAYAGEAYRSK